MATLHLMTGGKGGVGKTLCALCAALYYINRDERLILIDLNYHNHDFAEILDPLTDTTRQTPLRDSGFTIVPLHQSVNKAFGPTTYLVTPDSGSPIFGQLPWEGGLGIFRYIDNVLDAIGDGCGVEAGYVPDFCVIDTGLHLANLNPRTPREHKAAHDIIAKEMVSLTANRLYLWFVWTFATLDRHPEIRAASKAMEVLKAVSLDGRSWFNNRENLIHVINPHALAQPSKFRDWLIPTDSHCIKPLRALSKAPAVDSWPFHAFYTILRKAFQESVGDRSDIYFERIARSIGLPDRENIDTSKIEDWRRPENVFAIPYFSRRIVAFVDMLRHHYNGGSYNTHDLVSFFGKIYTTIHRYMGQRTFR